MRKGLRKPAPDLLVTLVLAGVAAALWAAWLGWDQHRDVHPDGSTTGPYEAWQVIGLGLTLLVAVGLAAFREYVVASVIGVTAGLTVASFYDWSDDSTGLFGVGVGLIMMGSLAATGIVSFLIASAKRNSVLRGAGH
ncbi:hypothetical protein [Streptomyces yaizuensis]|uniref:Integral membrane protein n=1 Tax=Streptomyces yaizuensis TaxID=2989713 RepID=A0ABQ5NX97_9ACTN|nr:hypothetical protein [Streptomyces sp. YSPA8]GLF94997.1 hypothetical protein SYYSPA8_11890 [Streptomyces sp. YSPA8]